MYSFLKHIHNLSEAGYSFEQALVPELRRFMDEKRALSSTIIDFGCGQKPFSYLFQGRFFNGLYIGMDVYQGKKVDVIYNGSDFPFANSSIDLIFSSSVFEHVENIEKILFEMARVLKDGGILLAVVPFTFPVHGSPFDYNRLTRYGWERLIRKICGDKNLLKIEPVDGRINCLVNMITAQVNSVLLDTMRWGKNMVFGRKEGKSLHEGGASPESHDNFEMRTVYSILRINPINFMLGMAGWLLSQIPIYRRVEGEITSGYLIKMIKGVWGGLAKMPHDKSS